ncbi:unnamed protein product [Citrullus colocynthis]|uniref:NADPH-dependent pterin aldehyde reductase-like n=1 Tax=Citrullus colocynthis TaxID=252529 RepID=A0ABP0Z4V0_9ROSI
MAAAPSESCPVQATAASRKVLIAGVSKGLGRALALEMASRGHAIFGCSRDQNKLHSLQAQLSKLISKSPFHLQTRCGVAHRNAKMWELNVEDFNILIDTNLAAYCASKWAIEGLSKCIAKGLPKEMTIVALDPGTIHTDMLILCLPHLGTTPFHFQSPQKWAIKAATMILDLSPKDNGTSLTIENPDELFSE